MARGKYRSARRGEEPEEGSLDDAEYEGEDDGEYEGEYEGEEDAEYEGEEDAEYEGEEDEAEYYDEDEDYEGQDEDASEPYTPPTALSALKQVFAGRQRARPATGTDEDARRVNYIDRRERAIGYFFGVLPILLAIVGYFEAKHFVDLFYGALGLLIIIATLSKRRAALGFAIVFAGLAVTSQLGVFGLVFIGVGVWLIFRALKRSPRNTGTAPARGRGLGLFRSRSAQSQATTVNTSATRATRTGTSSPTERRTIGRNGRLPDTTDRPTATPSRRYTPPKRVKRPPPPPPTEAEPRNPLSAWLRK